MATDDPLAPILEEVAPGELPPSQFSRLSAQFEQVLTAITGLTKSVNDTKLEQNIIYRKFDELRPVFTTTGSSTSHNGSTQPQPSRNPPGFSFPSSRYSQPPLSILGPTQQAIPTITGSSSQPLAQPMVPAPPPPPSGSSWRPPPSRLLGQGPGENQPRVRLEPPHFDGSDTAGWIFRVQNYFDYFMTTDADRLYFAMMLFDTPASDWIRYYVNNNPTVSWLEFLEAVKQRFDPEYYTNHVGCLAKLTQIGSVAEYQAAYEQVLNKISGVPDCALISIFTSGLKQPTQREVSLKKPTSLAEAMALAREHSASHADTLAAAMPQTRRPWQPCESRPAYPLSSSVSSPMVSNQPRPVARPSSQPYRQSETSMSKLRAQIHKP